MDKIVKIMYVTRKGIHKNIIEKYYTYGKSKSGTQINDMFNWHQVVQNEKTA